MNSAAPQIILDNIPSRLRQRDQWVLWQYATRDGKLTKIPFNARTGYEADATDPATWSTFEHAVEAHRKSSLWSGIGFVFSPDDPCCGVDLDDSIDPATGDFKPWAKTIIERLNSYCEISPSGVGVKLFLVATKPGARCRKGYEDGEVEIYDQERFFTVTGRRVDTISAEIEDRQEALVELYHQVFGEPEPPPPAPPPASNATRSTDLTDEQILEKAKRSRKTGQKFGDLWSGRWDGHFKSQSEGDSSLVFMIAFYTKDASQIDRMFRRCGLMRDKWDEKHGAKTYGQMTIDHALAQVSAQWQPAAARRASTDRDNAIWSPDHLSQQVNAERLVQILNGDARYNVNKGQWLWYDGRRFADDHGGEVARAAKRVARHTWRFVGGDLAGIEPKTAFKHALDSEKASGISAMMNLAQTEKGIPVLAEHFDADPYLFNCQNGTIDLGSGALRPHRRDDLLTKIAPVIYDPNAPRPLFSAFIERIMSQNQTMIAYLARLLGRCLSGDISEQELYFFIGEGANGKSVLVDTILGILGDYAGTAPESLLTVQAHS
jgi:putative DNA primase/helicase